MKYLIFDNELYFESQGEFSVIAKEETSSLPFEIAQDVSIAVVDTLQKQIAAPEKLGLIKEETLAGAFSGEYVTQWERLGQNLFQVIAIEKTRISEIYKYLGFENVGLVVPYGAAVREFLKLNNLFVEGKRLVFLDRLGSQVLLTIYHHDLFTAPRRLSTVPKRVVSELSRSQENYRAQEKSEAQIQFMVVTNDEEIYKEAIASGITNKDNAVIVQEQYPALAGLKSGKFSMHFLLPEQFIRLKKQKETKRHLRHLSLSLGVFAFSLIAAFNGFTLTRSAQMHLDSVRRDKEVLQQNLKAHYAAKYQDIVRGTSSAGLFCLFNSFLVSLPYGYHIDSVVIKKATSGVCRLEAIVYPDGNESLCTPTALAKSFKNAKIENILLKEKPAVKVVMEIGERG